MRRGHPWPFIYSLDPCPSAIGYFSFRCLPSRSLVCESPRVGLLFRTVVVELIRITGHLVSHPSSDHNLQIGQIDPETHFLSLTTSSTCGPTSDTTSLSSRAFALARTSCSESLFLRDKDKENNGSRDSPNTYYHLKQAYYTSCASVFDQKGSPHR